MKPTYHSLQQFFFYLSLKLQDISGSPAWITNQHCCNELHLYQWRTWRVTLFALSVLSCMRADTLISLMYVFTIFRLLLTAIKWVGYSKKNLKCSFCCWDEAGQKPGVSNERYARLSMVCQDTLIVLGHRLCPRVIYYPSQWAHSCLARPFHRALQSLCVHSTSPSPVLCHILPVLQLAHRH